MLNFEGCHVFFSRPYIMRGIKSRMMNMWDGACGTHGEKRIAFRGFLVKPKGNITLWEDKIKTGSKLVG